MQHKETSRYFQAHSERHGYLVQNTGNAANGSREADGSASKGHKTDEQGLKL